MFQILATAQQTGWLQGALRSVTAFIVGLVYGAISLIFKLIFTISEVTAGPDLLGDVYTRIYTILGVFMVFKLSFSFINYILNPDSLRDKDRGVGKLIMNTIIMLAALIFIPTYVFGSNGILIRAQKALLPMVPRIIMGIEEGSGAAFTASTDSETLEKYGDSMAVAALSAFFTPISGGNCDGTEIKTLEEFDEQYNDTCTPEGAALGQKYYKYHYDSVFAVVVGIVMVVVLLGIAIEVGKRVFKLLILEVIAPIPIMTLIDPKSSKGGTFNNWLKSITSTFLDIFIKLGVLYFVIMMIGLLSNNGISIFGEVDKVVFAFLMVVLLLFAKEAPKFIKDALGLKTDTGDFFGLGGLKSVVRGGERLAGGAVVAGGMLGRAGTAIADKTEGMRSNVAAQANNFMAQHPNLAKATSTASTAGTAAGRVMGTVGRAGMGIGRTVGAMANSKNGYRDVVTAGMSGANSRTERFSAANSAFEALDKVLDKEASKAGTTVSSFAVGGDKNNAYSGGADQYEDAYQRAVNQGQSKFSVGGATFNTYQHSRDSKQIASAVRERYLHDTPKLTEETKMQLENFTKAASSAGQRGLDQKDYKSLDAANKKIKDQGFRHQTRNLNANRYKAKGK